jgi:hypothetical protein
MRYNDEELSGVYFATRIYLVVKGLECGLMKHCLKVRTCLSDHNRNEAQ